MWTLGRHVVHPLHVLLVTTGSFYSRRMTPNVDVGLLMVVWLDWVAGSVLTCCCYCRGWAGGGGGRGRAE